MTNLEKQLAEALREFMSATDSGTGLKEMHCFDGRMKFYERINEIRRKADQVIFEFDRQSSQQNNSVPY